MVEACYGEGPGGLPLLLVLAWSGVRIHCCVVGILAWSNLSIGNLLGRGLGWCISL